MIAKILIIGLLLPTSATWAQKLISFSEFSKIAEPKISIEFTDAPAQFDRAEVRRNIVRPILAVNYEYLKEIHRSDRKLYSLILSEYKEKSISLELYNQGMSLRIVETPFVVHNTQARSLKEFRKQVEVNRILPYGIIFYPDPNAKESNTFKERWGHYGNSLTNKEKFEILQRMEAENASVILWTYDKTLLLAQEKQQKLLQEDVRSIIVKVPPRYQKEVQEIYKVAHLPWYQKLQTRTHIHYKRLTNPISSLKRAYLIAKSQYVKPNKEDVIAGFRMLATMLAVKLPVYYLVEMPQQTIAAIMTVESALTMVLTTYIKTIDNLFKANYYYDFLPGRGEFAKRMMFFTLPLTELWRYVVGPGLPNTAPVTSVKGQVEIIEQVLVGGSTSTAYNTSRNTYLSPDAVQRIYWYMSVPGTILTASNLAGLKLFIIPVGGLIEITAPLVAMTGLYLGVAYAIKKKPEFFEHLGRHGILKSIKTVWKNHKKRQELRAHTVRSCNKVVGNKPDI